MNKLTEDERAAVVKRLEEVSAKTHATELTLAQWSELQRERESLVRKLAIDDRARE